MNPLTNVKNIQKLNQRELALGNKKSWHDQYKDSAWVFIGGLPYDLTEGDIICVFSQYGEIVNLNLVRDKKSGKSKGFCFLCYEDQRSTILAVDNLNSIKLLGRTIRVDHVENYKMPKEHEEDDDLIKTLRTEGCGPGVKALTAKASPEEEEEEEDFVVHVKKPKKEKDKKAKKKKKEKKKKKKKSASSSDSDSGDAESPTPPAETASKGAALPDRDAVARASESDQRHRDSRQQRGQSSPQQLTDSARTDRHSEDRSRSSQSDPGQADGFGRHRDERGRSRDGMQRDAAPDRLDRGRDDSRSRRQDDSRSRDGRHDDRPNDSRRDGDRWNDRGRDDRRGDHDRRQDYRRPDYRDRDRRR